MRSQRKLLLLAAAVVVMITPSAASAAPPSPAPTTTQLLTGLEGGSGSTVGPGGALYVTESAAGRISRVDPRTGEITTFASGCRSRSSASAAATTSRSSAGPRTRWSPLSAPTSAAATLSASTGWTAPKLHRHRGHRRVRLEQSARSVRHPNRTPVRAGDLPRRVLGHGWAPQPGVPGHARRRRHELIAFGNIVPTGLETRGNTVYMAEAGPVPHDPEDGKVVSFSRGHPAPRRWPPVPHSSSTWSLAAVAICSPSRRASSVAALRVLRRRRTPAAS